MMPMNKRSTPLDLCDMVSPSVPSNVNTRVAILKVRDEERSPVSLSPLSDRVVV